MRMRLFEVRQPGREKGAPRLCIAQPTPGTISETFLRAHRDRLPVEVTVVHGADIPHVGHEPVLSQAIGARALRKLDRMVRRRSWSWEATLGYLKVFRRYGAQAVLAEYGPTGVQVLEACRLARLPLIVHFHGYDASVRDVLAKNAEGYERMFREARAVVAVSVAMRRRLIELGAPPEKVHLNPYGIDCERFARATPAQASPVFLAVGRFVEKKAPYLTILAFGEVYRRHPEARLRMIGDGGLLGPCRDLAQALGLSRAVTFLGAQPHDVVARQMREARCFVQHSVEACNGDSEGAPVAIMEASASGLPIVATRHAGIPDIVVDGQTGLLVDERDVAGMADRMLRLALDPEFAAALGRQGRQRVLNDYSLERSIGRLWAIIQSCMVSASAVKPNRSTRVAGG